MNFFTPPSPKLCPQHVRYSVYGFTLVAAVAVSAVAGLPALVLLGLPLVAAKKFAIDGIDHVRSERELKTWQQMTGGSPVLRETRLLHAHLAQHDQNLAEAYRIQAEPLCDRADGDAKHQLRELNRLWSERSPEPLRESA